MLVVGTSSLPVTVPQNAGLIASQFAAQGLDLFAPGGCTSPFTFTLGNALVVTIL